MEAIKIVLTSIIFSTILGFMLQLGEFATYTLISPVIFSAGLVFLVAVIAASNTTIVKGAALAIFWAWLILYVLNTNIPLLPSPMKEIIYAIITVPNILAIGLAFMELGKG